MTTASDLVEETRRLLFSGQRENCLDRLARKIDFGPSCWEWTAAKDPGGYGRVSRVTYGQSLAHRAVYEAAVGPIPEGLTLDHLCVNPSCVNPDHLEPVARAENSMRGEGPPARYARRTHCDNGHEFTPENTRIVPGGWRECRVCRTGWNRLAQIRRTTRGRKR